MKHRHKKIGVDYRWVSFMGWIFGGMGLALLIDSPALAAPLLQEASSGSTIWPVLVPLATASIGVERSTEVIWNYVEWAMLSSKRWQPADLKAAQYTQFKSGSSMLMGVIIGILVANYTNMRLFVYLQDYVPGFVENVPALWDTLITGLIIGSGAKPAHEILGIITQGKNFLSNASINQRESAGAALADGVLKLAESENKRMVDVPGVGPARIPMPAGAARGMPSPTGSPVPEGMEDDPGSAPATVSDIERYVDVLHNRTAY
ncbi:MAG: hypothetical protein AAF702_21595 [Chloroflexota bacterium]